MRLGALLQPIYDFLTSPLRIGALEISPTAIKYLLVRGNSIVQASLRLPPGVIEKGIIMNKPVLSAALKSLHAQITTANPKPINVVLTVPSHLVFAQAFTVPIVAKENLEEAIKLNLQIISPNKIEESYYDYQEIKINKDLGHLDLLGAFAPMKPIDELEGLLRDNNFIPITAEFPGLSLGRLIRQRWGGIELEQDYLLIYISSEGVLLMILKNGNLAFNHFIAWQSEGGAEVPLNFTQVQDLIKHEIQRVVNFYLGRTGKTIEQAVLISPVFNYEIVKLATEELKLKIRNLSIAELPKLQPSWFPVLGAALRGLVSRSRDTDISLSAIGSQTEYYHERALNFVSLWRTILIGTLVLILTVFATIDTVFSREQHQLEDRMTSEFDTAVLKNSGAVQTQITAFNQLLTTIEETKKKESVWTPSLTSLTAASGKDISFDRIFIVRPEMRGTIGGKGSSDQAILAFKERLLKDPHIDSVTLPLSSIRVQLDKTAEFEMQVKLKTL